MRMAICVPLLLLVMACGSPTQGKSAAEAEVLVFRELLQDRQFEALYQRSSSEFRASAPRQDVLALFDAIDRKLGPLQHAELVNSQVNSRNLVTTVALVYESQYEGGMATETFTYRIRDNGAEMLGYNIDSLAMLIR